MQVREQFWGLWVGLFGLGRDKEVFSFRLERLEDSF